MTMPESVPVTHGVRPLSFGLRLYILFASCTLLFFPLHESAHYLTYRLLGVHLHMTLNTASPADQAQRRPIAELAAPMLNLVVAIAAAFAYHHSQGRREWWAALGLASAMMRLVVYALVVGAAIVTGSGLSLGNDEPIAAHLWGLPSLAFVGVFTAPFGFVVWSIVRTSQEGAGRKALHLLGLGLTTLSLGMLVGNVLDPLLFPNR